MLQRSFSLFYLILSSAAQIVWWKNALVPRRYVHIFDLFLWFDFISCTFGGNGIDAIGWIIWKLLVYYYFEVRQKTNIFIHLKCLAGGHFSMALKRKQTISLEQKLAIINFNCMALGVHPFKQINHNEIVYLHLHVHLLWLSWETRTRYMI